MAATESSKQAKKRTRKEKRSVEAALHGAIEQTLQIRSQASYRRESQPRMRNHNTRFRSRVHQVLKAKEASNKSKNKSKVVEISSSDESSTDSDSSSSDGDLLENDYPEADPPEVYLQETNLPETNLPEDDLPEDDLPEDDLPEVDLPDADLPEADDLPEEKRTRGPSTLWLSNSSKDQPKLNVVWNELGQPVEGEDRKLSSWCGILARTHVPITIRDWRFVPKSLKDDIFKLVEQRFNVDRTHKKWCLKTMNNSWRDYKCDIGQQVEAAAEKEESAKEISKIRPANIRLDREWDNYVKHRLSNQFAKYSAKMKALRNKQEIVHTTSRMGFARLKEKMVKESSHPSLVRRHHVWTKGYTSKNNELINAKAKKQMEKVDGAVHELNQRGDDLDIDMRNDPLSKVFGPDRPGRLRGMGAGVTLTTVEAHSSYSHKIRKLEEIIKSQQKEITSTRAELDSYRKDMIEMKNTVHQLSKNQGLNTLGLDEDRGSSRVADQVQHGSVGQDARCLLLDWTNMHKEEVVAEGRIHSVNPMSQCHCIPLGKGMWKVWIDAVINEEAVLPRPTSEFLILGDAIGSTVAWPQGFIKLI